MTKPPENVKAFLEVLAGSGEEPQLKVASQVLPKPAVVVIVQYPSGAITVPLTPATARQVAATMVEYADDLEKAIRERN